MTTAALGTEFELDTLDGKKTVTINADSIVTPTDSQFAGATPVKFHSDTDEPYPSGLDTFMGEHCGLRVLADREGARDRAVPA